MKQIKASKEVEGLRLDKALTILLEDVSRSKIQSHLENGLFLVNGKTEKSSYKLSENDVIEVADFESKKLDVNPEDIPLDIVYEDNDVIVVNKPK